MKSFIQVKWDEYEEWMMANAVYDMILHYEEFYENAIYKEPTQPVWDDVVDEWITLNIDLMELEQ